MHPTPKTTDHDQPFKLVSATHGATRERDTHTLAHLHDMRHMIFTATETGKKKQKKKLSHQSCNYHIFNRCMQAIRVTLDLLC